MTVKELIEVLQKVENKDMRILISGYEGGHNDLETSANNIQEVALNVNEEWYYGSHEIVGEGAIVHEGVRVIKAIIL